MSGNTGKRTASQRAKALVRDLFPQSISDYLEILSKEMLSMAHYGRPGMFRNVAIETTSICNRVCTYCPNSNPDLKAQRPMKNMTMELYGRIIEQLSDVQYKGTVALQHYGEPLLDRKLEDRVEMAHTALPQAHIIFASNGDHLTPDRYVQLIKAGIENIIVTNHNEDGTPPQAIPALRKYLEEHPEHSKHLIYRSKVIMHSNRGGLVKVDEQRRRKLVRCIPESYSVNIDVEGNVILCANDYLGQERFGNIKERHLQQIWDNADFSRIRSGNRAGAYQLEICKKCTGDYA